MNGSAAKGSSTPATPSISSTMKAKRSTTVETPGTPTKKRGRPPGSGAKNSNKKSKVEAEMEDVKAENGDDADEELKIEQDAEENEVSKD